MISCYKNIFRRDEDIMKIDKNILKIDNIDIFLNKENYLLGYLSRDEGFETFIKKITKIPKECADKSFTPQSLNFYSNYSIDFIGRIENFPKSFDKLKKIYGFDELEIHTLEKSEWIKYYNDEIANLVYNFFEEDFNLFGYEKRYEKMFEVQ